MPSHAQMTSSDLVPKISKKSSVNCDLVLTSSHANSRFQFDLVPPRPEIYAQFDLVPTSSRHWDELNRQISHDFVPLSPLERGEVGTRWARVRT